VSIPSHTSSGPAAAPVRVRARHLAGPPPAPEPPAPPTDPAYPDYPYFLDHHADARVRHLYAVGGLRWGRHPGFPARDPDLHVPAGDRRGGFSGGGVAGAALGLVAVAAWGVAVTDVSAGTLALLALGWLVAAVVAREALVYRTGWTRCWRAAFAAAGLLASAAAAAGAVVAGAVPEAWLPGAPGEAAVLGAGLRVGAAVAASAALLLWAPVVRDLSIIADRLGRGGRSTLVR
jgi:hypothetical protein